MHFMAIDKEIPMRQELKGPTSKSIVYNLKMLSQSMWLQRHMTSITSSLINRWWQDTIEWVFVELALDIRISVLGFGCWADLLLFQIASPCLTTDLEELHMRVPCKEWTMGHKGQLSLSKHHRKTKDRLSWSTMVVLLNYLIYKWDNTTELLRCAQTVEYVFFVY